MSKTVNIQDIEDAGLMPAIFRQSENEYPSECCGLILRNDQGGLTLLPCVNLQDDMHSQDPVSFPRTSATAYSIDPRIIMDNEPRMVCIYHSHPDHGAYFSEEDQLIAAPFGEPNFPNVSYLVVSVMQKKVAARKMYVWSDSAGRFVDEDEP